MRDPSIHITLSQFKGIFASMGLEMEEEDILDLFKRAKDQSLDHRSTYNSRVKKKFERSLESNSIISDTNLLTELFYAIQVKNKIPYARKIKQSDNQWVQAREATEIANQFCVENNLEKREGYIKLLNCALEYLRNQKKTGSFRFFFSWLCSRAIDIVEFYKTSQSIKEDPYPQETQRIYDIYRARVLETTGIPYSVDRDKNPNIWNYFIQAREQADSMNVDYEDYIDAQFAALEYCHGIPWDKDLFGERAQNRLIKYSSRLGGISKEPQDSNIDWSNFKN